MTRRLVSNARPVKGDDSHLATSGNAHCAAPLGSVLGWTRPALRDLAYAGAVCAWSVVGFTVLVTGFAVHHYCSWSSGSSSGSRSCTPSAGPRALIAVSRDGVGARRCPRSTGAPLLGG